MNRILIRDKTKKSINTISAAIILLILSTTAYSYDLAQCVAQNNISCQNCAAVTININTAEIKDSIVVGDHYKYSINLTNIGNTTLNRTYNIRILNPSYVLQDTTKYENTSIPPGGELILSPNRSKNQVDTFDLGISGSNIINLSADQETTFYRFYNDCTYITDQKSYWHYFDVMPRWQYTWNKKLEGWQTNTQTLSTNTQKLTENTENLTYLLIILTILTIITELREDIGETIKKLRPKPKNKNL